MKNLKWLLSASIVLSLFLSSCVTPTIGSNDSEKTITNEVKTYTVLGNLRVEVTRKDNEYDKIMTAAIQKFGERVDVINLKTDTEMSSYGSKIINCLVIKYD